MIQFRVDGTKVIASVKGGYDTGDTSFPLSFDTGSLWSANMLFWHLQNRMQKQLSDIRAEEYERGWKDAKAKKTEKATCWKAKW